MSLVDVDALTVELRASAVPIVRDFSLRLESGQVMGLVGESGSGKSTVALALLGYARPGGRISSGVVEVDGTDLLALPTTKLRAARGTTVAYVPQDPGTALTPNVPVGTQIVEGLGRGRRRARRALKELLDQVGLPNDPEFLARKPHQLSGGQQQRIAIAMAMIGDPRLLVLDEPTTGLDVTTQSMVLDLVERLCASREMAAVYVTHDLAVVAEVAHTVTVLYGGLVVERGRCRDVLRDPAHPYTRALLGAVPSARERLRLVPIKGRAPGLDERPDGCVFAPRCPFATNECRAAEPGLRTGARGREARCIRLDEVAAHSQATTKVRDAERPAPAEPVLAAHGLDASYNGVRVLAEVDVEVGRGECVAVVGESGSGKTTMSRCLVGLHHEWRADLTLHGERLPLASRRRSHRARRELQYIFQNPYASLNPRRTIGDSLAEAPRLFFDVARRDARERIETVLDRVELPGDLADRYPAELSGGQRQRVAIARALLCDPSVLICDEVTSSLDVSVQASIIELLRTLTADGLGMVFVTHNLAVVRSIADRIVVLEKGRVVEAGRAGGILDAPEAPYTRSLLADTLEVA